MRFAWAFSIAALILAAAGCQGPTQTVQMLEADKTAPADVITVPITATYRLYTLKKEPGKDKEEEKEVYSVELKKGEKVGFMRADNRIHATARGIQIDLPEREDGATYVWKVEEKR